MAKKLGNDYRLWIETVTVGTYTEIKGQQNLSQGGTASTIDISDKTNSPYSLSAPGLFDMPINFELYPDLPDALGYTRFETLFLSQSAVKYQIRKGGSAGATPADVVFEGSCYILQLAKTYNKNDVLKVTGALGLAAAPTINALA